MKWINEGGIYFPTAGEITFFDTPGNGVFQIALSPNPMDKRLGLRKVSDKFEFDFKIYDIGYESFKEKIKKVWNSEKYNKNLGVIANGLKGCGKTIFTKILCNEIGLPVILVDNDFEGQILPFITSLNFECIVFLDEAEKMFNDNPEVLLKLIDGAFNVKRKLYLLTTNNLTVDNNLIDRPGRIRYIQEFGNLSAKAISECIDDNLINLEYKDLIVKLVDRLEFSTIDILKNIIEEVNILGPESIESEINNLNIPIASYTYDAVAFVGIEPTEENIALIMKEAETEKDLNEDEKVRRMSPSQFLTEYVKSPQGDWEYGYDIIVSKVKDIKWSRDFTFKTSSPEIQKGKTNNGQILGIFEKYPGFFMYTQIGWDDPCLCMVTDKHRPVSLYQLL